MTSTIRKSFSIITAVLILFSLFIVIAEVKLQTAAADTPESYFENPPGSDWGVLYSDDASEDCTAHSAIQVADGYVVAGTQTGPAGPGLDWWAVLAKINLTGTAVVDSAAFSTDGDHNAAYDIVSVADGYVITGNKHQGADPPYDPYIWLMKTNTSLDRQWEQTYGNAYPDYGNSVFVDNSGFIIGGFQGNGGLGSGWLIHTDYAGIQDWDVNLDSDPPGTNWMGKEVYSVAQTSDEGYILGTKDGIVKTGDVDTPGDFPDHIWTAASGDAYYSVQQTSDGGYIGVGATLGSDATYDVLLTKLNSGGTEEWSYTYSSDAMVPDIVPDVPPDEYGRHVVQTSDGGYAIVGRTGTITHDGTAFYGNGDSDVWILKVNGSGELQWDLALGGDGPDSGNHIVETSDDDLLVCGSATVGGVKKMWVIKVNGDFAPPTTSFTYTPESPVFVGQQVRFNASASTDADGTIETYEWDFGDGNTDTGVTADHTYRTPGTYTVTLAVTDNDGATRSTSDDVTVVELGMAWERIIDGADSNVGLSIVEAHDGGYVIAGYTENGAYGGTYTDGWLLKVNDDSTIAWERKFADHDNVPQNIQSLTSVAKTADGGYITTGLTRLSTHSDLWLIKTGADGTPTWYKTFGGAFAYNDEGNAVAQTADGGYIITGYTSTAVSSDSHSVWLIKTDASGNLTWSNTFDDADDDYRGYAVAQTFDGGYVIATDGSDNDTDVNLIKTSSTGVEEWTHTWDGTVSWAGGRWISETTDRGFAVAGILNRATMLGKVSSTNVEQWKYEYDDGTNNSYGQDAATTPDGGYLIVGYTETAPDDVYLVKTDSAGIEEWDTTFGTAETDEGSGVIALADGGYVVMYNRSSTGDTDLCLRRYGYTGVFSTSGTVTVTEWSVTENTGLDPETYDTAGAPGGIDLDNARGFEISATGADGTYRFRINFTTPIDSDFTLYKLPGWTVVPYTVIDEYTIEVELDIVGGVLDPPFMFIPNSAPGQPTNTVPANAATGVAITPTLSSSAFSDVDTGDTHTASQWLITATSGDYSSPIYDSGTDTSNKTSITVPASTLDTNTTYYFKVRHQDNHSKWSDWSFETLFSTLNTAPDQPTNVTPSDGATDVTLTPTLESSAFTDADTGDTHAASQWHITETQGDYSSVLFDSGADSTNKTSITIPSSTLDYSTSYYFRLQYQDNHGTWSGWSDETSFTTTNEPNTAPGQPANSVPADEATGVAITPTLSSSAFADSDSGDTHAASQWQITTTESDYSEPVYDSGTDSINKISITVPAETLEAGTTYYWRLRHQDNHSEWSGWSAETSFTTVAGGGCGCSSVPATVADLVSGWSIIGLLGITGILTGQARKKGK